MRKPSCCAMCADTHASTCPALNAVPITSEPKPTEEQLGVPDWTKAPNGATHFDNQVELFCQRGWWWSESKKWTPSVNDSWGSDRYTPRPVGPETTAWDGTGRPPVGCICEAVWLEHPDSRGRDFESVHIKAYFGFQVWFESQSLDEVVCEIRDCEFRPIRTQAQRERDDAIEKALAMDCHPREGMLSRHDFCGALYDAGMLKYPK